MPDEQLDEWLKHPSSVDRTAFASLKRILESQRLKGRRVSHEIPVPAVCFSATPLSQLLKRRTFRPHRTRWDAEPYGLSIRRNVLEKFGARPVVYGTISDRPFLAEKDKLWFQVAASQTPTDIIDWTIEQEWRLPGDLDLSLVTPGDAFVFVKSAAEATLVQTLSRWPVIIAEAPETPCERPFEVIHQQA